ncbi:glycine cleavage system protein GcvH [bacterium]|nr:glycine cleavage system protein GcvH [bacterium]
MNVPEKMHFTKEHEWVLVEGDTATIGISEYAQGELGDIVFVELPQVGDSTTQFQPCANIEAVKAVSDLYCPISGEIIEVNDGLDADPQLINKDPFGQGWILKIKISDVAELKNLMDAENYKAMIS